MLSRDAIRETFDLLDYPNVRWAAIRRDGKLDGGYAVSAAELASFAEAYRGWNLYVQPNPSTRLGGVRVTADDVTEWRWFVVDLDPDFPGTIGPENPARTEVVHAMQGYFGTDVEPLVMFSGRGYQLWYRVNGYALRPGLIFAATALPRDADEALVVAELPMVRAIAAASRYWLSRLASRMRPEWGVEIDTSVSDLPRLARCPGTMNQKTGNLAVVLHESHGALDGKNFLRWVPTREYVGASKTGGPSVGEGAPWQAADAFLTLRASAFLARGEGEPGRHAGMAATARSLAEAGLGYEAVVEALYHGGAKCFPPLEDPAFIERTAREALARVNRESDLTR